MKTRLLVPELPSTTLTGAIVTFGNGSSFEIVTVPVLFRIEAFTGFDRVTVKNSSGS